MKQAWNQIPPPQEATPLSGSLLEVFLIIGIFVGILVWLSYRSGPPEESRPAPVKEQIWKEHSADHGHGSGRS